MRKIVSFIISICIGLSFIGCAKDSSTVSNGTFDESKAISMVIKDHTDFPSSQADTITKELSIGGIQGSTANVKFTTNVEKSSKSDYIVRLTKDWGITVNGKYAKSSWKYKVTQDGITLLESNDNDNLITIIK